MMNSFKPKILILTYHRVLPQAAPGAVSVDVFADQLEYLCTHNWHFINASDLLALWDKSSPPPAKRLVMLTFDDGWADNLFYADPVLERFQACATLALNTGLINPDEQLRSALPDIVPAKTALGDAVYNRSRLSFLTWPELLALRDTGRWDIQAHAHTHLGCYHNLKKIKGFYPDKQHWTMEYALGEPPFPGAPLAPFSSILTAPCTRLHPDLAAALKKTSDPDDWRHLCRSCPQPLTELETESEFASRIRADLACCRNLIRKKLQCDPHSLFWPWGHYSPASVAAARDCGFSLLFTMDKDAVDGPHQRWQLPRIAAPETMSRFRKQMLVFSHPLLRRLRAWWNK